MRLNFVTSLDGSVTLGGRSGPLGGPADHRVFDLLRRQADVVLLGAGTARIEGYGGFRVDQPAQTWRVEHGRTPHPAFALVSGGAHLDPESPIFTDAPQRPIVFTLERADAERRAALARVADVVVVGDDHLDVAATLDVLAARGLTDVLCEGGPTLAGTLIDADAVDEICLTLDPAVVGGAGSRVTHGAREALHRFSLVSTLRAGDALLLRYARLAPNDA